MKALSRKLLAVISTSLLFSATPGIAVAQSSFSGSSTSDDFQSVIEPSETPNSAASLDNSIASEAAPSQAVDGPFAEWGIPTPPGAEGYEVNQVTEEDLNPQGLDEWHPTANPNKEIVPGQMRSDREEIPAGVDKVEADKAEVREAQLADPDTPTLNARPGCGVYWPTRFEVCGLIKEKYDSIGGPKSFLLLPKSNELTNPDGVGKRSEFANGFIYWHPKTGAHTVSLPVSVVWARHGWEKGFLGYPTTSDIPQGNAWYKQDFQGGHVYTHNTLPATQASIQGRIYDKWQSMGAQNSELGYPISDELTTPDGVGRYNVFEGGMIYWTPTTGAHSISGGILASWATQGYEKSAYGYPIGDMSINDQEVQEQHFQGGVLYADPSVFWQPFSCFSAATRIAEELGIPDGAQFMCSNRGVSLNANGIDYFGMPTVEDVSKKLPIANLQAAGEVSAPTGIECDVYDSGLIKGPRRYSDHKVSKTVKFCIGETKRVSPFEPLEPKWSREFEWTISDSLKQRQYAEVTTNVDNLDLPSFKFRVNTRLREDVKWSSDKTAAELTSIVTKPGLKNASRAEYQIPKKSGTFFTEVDGIYLNIPSWGYEQSYDGYQFAIGRFECPQYSPNSNLCVFTNPVDDHTFD